jgi:hypothetical protein
VPRLAEAASGPLHRPTDHVHTGAEALAAAAAALARRAMWNGPAPSVVPAQAPAPVTPPRYRAGISGEIITAAARLRGVSESEILGDTRRWPATEARHAAMVALQRVTGWTSPRIGARFGKDHSSVCNATQRVRGDEKLRALVEQILAAVSETQDTASKTDQCLVKSSGNS